jgi:hypothetical protein
VAFSRKLDLDEAVLTALLGVLITTYNGRISKGRINEKIAMSVEVKDTEPYLDCS